MTLETRSLVEPVEFRSAGTKLVAAGVAMRYGVKSKPFPRAGKVIKEEFRSGAFDKTISERDVIAIHEHERRAMLGRTSSGTLRLINSPSELAYEIDLPDTTVGRDVAVLLERDDIQGSSVGFRSMPKDEQWSVDTDGLALRSVGTSMLDHISTTVAPVHDSTSVELALRSLAEQTGMELRSLVDAAASGDLPSLMTGTRPVRRPGSPLIEVRAELVIPDGMTVDDVRAAVSDVVSAAVGPKTDCWVNDLGADWVVYEVVGDGLYRRGFSIDDDGGVSLTGKPEKVVRQTTYAPEARSQPTSDGRSNTVARPAIRGLYL